MSMALTQGQVARLNAWRFRHQYDVVKLKLAMDAPFKSPTLKTALDGKPVGEATWKFLANWIDDHEPAPPPPLDRQRRAAGERPES
jgi:hypothetical protein